MSTDDSRYDRRYVFVYGTLRRGESNDIHRFSPAPRFVGEASIDGQLYDLGPYPGARLGGVGRVRGEVYEISPALEVLLDELEEVRPHPTGEYARREIWVDVGGTSLPCLCYEISLERIRDAKTLTHGDWCLRDREPGRSN